MKPEIVHIQRCKTIVVIKRLQQKSPYQKRVLTDRYEVQGWHRGKCSLSCFENYFHIIIKAKTRSFCVVIRAKTHGRIVSEFVKSGKECRRILPWTIWCCCTTNTFPVVSGNLVCDESVVWCSWKGGTGSGGDQFFLIPKAGGHVLPHLTNQLVLFVPNVT